VLRGEYLPSPPGGAPGRAPGPAKETETSATTSDGEGFRVGVELVEEPWGHPAWETRTLPYTDPVMHGLPDPMYAVELLKLALRKANAGLFKRGAKPVPMPDVAKRMGFREGDAG
jgi:hypothetical protein